MPKSRKPRKGGTKRLTDKRNEGRKEARKNAREDGAKGEN